MNKIGIIGAGSLGARHLQAFSLADRVFEIYTMDTSSESLDKAKTIFQNTDNSARHKVHYITSIHQFPEQLDVVIVATNSNVRKNAIEELLKHSNVRYLLLEKVLFQRMEDYDTINTLISEKNIKTWVNCGRRSVTIYKELKEKLQEANSMEINISGSSWGLGCNCIHMLDLIAFLAGSRDVKVDISDLENNYVESKRRGFLEINGTIKGSMGRCTNFAITSYSTSNSPVSISINSDILKSIVDESKSFAYISSKENDWNWEKKSFRNLYQSEKTHLVIQDIIDKGTCDLVEYKESAYLHKSYIEPLITYFSDRGVKDGSCPIT